MEHSDVKIVQKSFARVFGDHSELTTAFYAKFFLAEPAARLLFPEGNTRKLHKMLLSLLSFIVKGLGDIDTLRPILIDLGKKHADIGVEARMYKSWELAFTQTIAEILHQQDDPALAHAWAQAFEMISSVMISASEGSHSS